MDNKEFSKKLECRTKTFAIHIIQFYMKISQITEILKDNLSKFNFTLNFRALNTI